MTAGTVSAPRTSLQRALEPASVAVVGVSEDALKYGSRLARSIVEAGFPGRLFFVNPKPGSFLGHDFVPSLTSIGEAVDVVVVSVPSTRCPEVVAEAGALGCGAAVVVANGFSEVGEVELEQDLRSRAAAAGISLIGPNCMGLFSHPGQLNAMGDSTIPGGRVAVVAQSGNVGIGIYHAAKQRGFGLSYFISVGNQADVAFEDILDYLAADTQSDVILLYVEGFRDLARFLRTAAALVTRKPVVILRGGRTPAGARSAASHTGSMAGDDAVTAAALRRAGLVEVDSTRELLLAAMAFVDPTPMRGRTVSVVADSGGYATLGADAAVRAGLAVEPHAPSLRERLGKILLPQASVANPVDMIGGPEVRPDIFQRTIESCLEDATVDGVALVGAYGGYGDFGGPILSELERVAAEELVQAQQRCRKPLVVQSIYAGAPHPGIDILRSHDVPVVDDLDDAMRILAMKASAGERPAGPQPAWANGHHPEAVRVLREDESRTLLAESLSDWLPAWHVVEDEDSAVHAAAALEGPVVIKVLAEGANHKSDVGGVILNLRNEQEMRRAWGRIVTICTELGEPPRALITAYHVGPVEAMVGFTRHAELGPVVLLGSGGVFAEAVLDRTLLFPPFDLAQAGRELDHLILGRTLRSDRAAGVMRDDLLRIAVAAGALALQRRDVMELDLNPILLSSGGGTILDVRVVAS